jgi:hypothetical protein
MDALVNRFNRARTDLIDTCENRNIISHDTKMKVIRHYQQVASEAISELNSYDLSTVVRTSFDYAKLWDIIKTIGDDILFIIKLLQA